MEGGYLPWKNKSREVVDEVDAAGKPLPPPPSGWFWSRESSGSWVLQEFDRSKEESQSASAITLAGHSVIDHTIMPEDTLQGICLRYRVSVTDVRRINMFSGNSIQFKKTLRIPLSKDVTISTQEDTHEVLIQKFRNETGESIAEARIYLEDNNWQLEVAVAVWKGDENWEEKQYVDKLSETILTDGQLSSMDDPKLAHKRTAFAATVGDVNVHKEAVPVAIRIPREVAPFTVIEMLTLVPANGI